MKYLTLKEEDLRVGRECEILPINESLGWQKGKLEYHKGFTGAGAYGLRPFWYSLIQFEGNYGPTVIQLKDLEHIRVIDGV